MERVVRKLTVLLARLILLLLFPAGAHAEDCKFDKKIDTTLDLSSSETLTVIAGAGRLSITGETGTDEAVIKGTVCASKEEWLDESSIETRVGDIAKIEVELPDIDSGWSFTGKRYACVTSAHMGPINCFN